MKVLFQCNAISPYRNDFFNELSLLCDLTVAYETENSEHTHRDKKWFEGLVCNYKKIKLNKKRCFFKFYKGEIKQLLLKGNFDVVILGNYLSFTGLEVCKVCKKLPTKIFVSADGALPKKDGFLKYYIKRKILKRCDYFLSPSEKTDEYFLNYKIKKEKIFRYNFTNLASNEILPFFKRQEKQGEQVVILGVGQFIYRKGFDVLIRACKDLPVKLVLVGGEPTDEYLKIISEEKVKNVEFYPFKAKQDLSKKYLESDIFVLPTRDDPWGLVINEAMNYSLPIITTDKCVAGLDLIAEGKGGFIIKSDSVSELSQAIGKLLNYDLRISFGKYNNEKIQGDTIENMAKSVERALKNGI